MGEIRFKKGGIVMEADKQTAGLRMTKMILGKVYQLVLQEMGRAIYRKRSTIAFIAAIIVSLFLSHYSTVWANNCSGFLNDTAHVISNPPGNDYDVWFTDDDMTSSHYFDSTRASWVRDALLSTHNILTSTTHNFSNPYFSDTPNDTCIYDSANIGTAPNNRITLDSPSLRTKSEPYIRNIVAHELFHHVEFSYINFNDWPSWGAWTVEGTARAMEDKLTMDNDQTPANTLYVGEVNNYLNNPNRTLFNISYTSALFWTYLMEQLGTPSLEPAIGVDVIQRFWSFTSGHSPDSVKYLRDTIQSFAAGRTLEDIFRDFAITNYTHDLDVSLLPDPDRYSYLDESAAGGGTPYNAVVKQTVSAFNTTLSSSVVRWGARYFEANVPTEQECEAIGFWAKAEQGKILSYAIVGIKNGNQVTDIYRSSGNEFYKALVNPRGDLYDKLALIIIGLNNSADFDYAFGFGSITGEIRRPTLNRMAYVGEKHDPERFQARLLLEGPSSLTPSGTGNISIKGLDPTLFEVTLKSSSTSVEYAAEILNASYVSGEYWLTIQAPEITNPLDGDLYDLEICFCDDFHACTQLLTSQKSVLYADITLNQMHVVDISYSMHYPTPAEESKITAAKNAVRMYINAGDDDDLMGIASFNGNNSECDDDASLDFALKNVSGNRSAMISTVNGLVEAGWTSIGDGLKKGRNELLLSASGIADVKSIVLYSDGMENEGDFWDESNPACSTLPVKSSFDPDTGIASDIRIDTIAFGPYTNQELLQNIALFTDGDYYAVSTDAPTSIVISSVDNAIGASALSTSALNPAILEIPNRLSNVYRTIEEDIHGQDRLFSRISSMAAGVPETFDIPVTEKKGGGVRDAVFAFNWHKDVANMTVELRDPDGYLVTGATPGWTVQTNLNPTEPTTNKIYQFNGILPIGYWWEVTLDTDTDLQAISMLSGRIVRGVDMNVYMSSILWELPEQCYRLPLYNYLRGLPVTIISNLTDTAGGIQGLIVEAEIFNPDGSINRLTLYDDGQHNDGQSHDGIYANAYTRTPFYSHGGVSFDPAFLPPPDGGWGSYNVVVSAAGLSNYQENFERTEMKSFHVFEYEKGECLADTDNDQLPDRWEDFYGLNKYDPSDAVLDYDNDKLINRDEFYHGTLPFDPDTDNGGESDGSEVLNGRDPLYDKDDKLPAIVDYGVVTQRNDIPVHIPRPKTNILHFPINDAYQAIQIWRTDPGWLGFQMVELFKGPSGVYYDKGLNNGVTYQYYLVAEGLSGSETAPTEVFTGTPKDDPIPPKGWLMINNGASKSDSPNVKLQFDTSDESKMVRVSQDPTFAGSIWNSLLPEDGFVLSDPGGLEPFQATVYAQYRDAALNESIVYSASIIVDKDGDEDGDGAINSLDTDDDGDGLDDNLELNLFRYDPFKADTDNNGVEDDEEDADRDLISNRKELVNGTDPLHNLSDINNDYKFNAFDINSFRNLYINSLSGADVNGDGFINAGDVNDFRNAFRNEQSFRVN